MKWLFPKRMGRTRRICLICRVDQTLSPPAVNAACDKTQRPLQLQLTCFCCAIALFSLKKVRVFKMMVSCASVGAILLKRFLHKKCLHPGEQSCLLQFVKELVLCYRTLFLLSLSKPFLKNDRLSSWHGNSKRISFKKRKISLMFHRRGLESRRPETHNRWNASIFSISVFPFTWFASSFPVVDLTFWDLIVLLGDTADWCPLGLNHLDAWSLSW